MRCRPSLEADTVETSAPSGVLEQNSFIGGQGAKPIKAESLSAFWHWIMGVWTTTNLPLNTPLG